MIFTETKIDERTLMLIQKKFKDIEKAIQENPERAREITANASPYVKNQIEKIIAEKSK